MIIISFQSLALPSDKCQVGGRASSGGSATMAEQIREGVSFFVSDRQLLSYINHHHENDFLLMNMMKPGGEWRPPLDGYSTASQLPPASKYLNNWEINFEQNVKRPASLQLPGQPVQLGGKEFAPAEKVGQSEELILREAIMGLKSQILYPPLPSLWLTVRTNFSTVWQTSVTQCNGNIWILEVVPQLWGHRWLVRRHVPPTLMLLRPLWLTSVHF